MKEHFKKCISVFITAVLIIIALPFTNERVNADGNIYETKWKEYNLGPANKGYYFEPAEEGQFPVLIFVHESGGPSDIPHDDLRNLFEYWTYMGYMDKMVIILPTIETGTAPSIYEAFRYWGQQPAGIGLLGQKITDGSFSTKIDTSAEINV